VHSFFLGGCGKPGNGDNPLLLSGLAMAGARDGIVMAEEIVALDLDGLQWAVLSACDTGLGELKSGEDVFGLRRAFQLAGARTVILSLWPVDDSATREWMNALYRLRYVNGKDTASSVKTASMEALTARRARHISAHPFYWAGFVATGDWR
jgi:CHAT domain-containing protein